jgi:hypothetical protein
MFLVSTIKTQYKYVFLAYASEVKNMCDAYYPIKLREECNAVFTPTEMVYKIMPRWWYLDCIELTLNLISNIK